ncbi:MAG: hydroxymethylglutaryl-CoA reductase, degradative [Peptococcaceae bacterium]|nr:hydroxymethylglutaryl-CoA reductase, degradative [Peptococcaceae bacterium]MDH7524262.1 hydroxymethylglutaryl-CoA reductase, degradative [Peptococcaceae bacterium]
MGKTSIISGFYKLSRKERIDILKDFAGLDEADVALLKSAEPLPMERAEKMVENVVGKMEIPLGLAANFLINGREYFIPMAIEEPSVIAAASHAAKLTISRGGITASNTGPVMIAQIQTVHVPDPFAARMAIYENKEEIIARANEQDPVLVKLGGGVRDIEVRVFDTIKGPMVVTHLIVDTRDAMGANAVNTMAEALAPLIERITGGKVYLRILSNLAVKRLVRAKCVVAKEELGGDEVVEGIVQAYAFAEADPFRAATHNKGIMNGISAVVLATGNDTRAIEAGCHAYAARNGRYTSLSTWERNRQGDLVGTLEAPLAVGLVGGATATHPMARLAVKILGVKTAVELGEIIGAVGLVQNLAALRVLATEGVQRGHMALHARNIAINAGATGELIDQVAEIMVKEGKVKMDRALEILKEIT